MADYGGKRQEIDIHQPRNPTYNTVGKKGGKAGGVPVAGTGQRTGDREPLPNLSRNYIRDSPQEARIQLSDFFVPLADHA